MVDKLNFELVSPERRLAREACDMVVVPGEEGELGILAGHAPIIALLQPGVVAVYQGDRIEKRFFVAGGFAEVTAAGCVLLTQEGIDLDDMSTAAADLRLDTARRDLLDVVEEGPVRDRAAKAVRVAEALVEATAA